MEMPERTEAQDVFETAMRDALKRLGWSQARLAREMGETEMNVSRVLSGKNETSHSVMKRFLRAVGLIPTLVISPAEKIPAA